ncbi:hypothetical protein KBC40_00075 [Patescibacteria group bacterium]|nr:hypothetical protein [Patescibacteria group bacterium]
MYDNKSNNFALQGICLLDLRQNHHTKSISMGESMKNAMLGLIFGLLAMLQFASAAEKVGTSFLNRSDLEVWGTSQLVTTFEGDSLARNKWSYAIFGAELWINGRQSLDVFSIKAEGQLAYGIKAENLLTEAFAQQDWRQASGLGASFRAGQYQHLSRANFALPHEAALPRRMDVEVPFTENLSGGAFSAYWDQQDTLKIPAGFKMSWGFGKSRPMPQQSWDTLLVAFPEPRWSWGAAYHITGYFGATELHLGWEKEVGHNASLYIAPHVNVDLGLSWTYSFHPHSEIAPDNLYAAKLSWRFWQSQTEKHSFSVVSGLDFGDQTEALQALLGYQWKLPIEGFVKLQAGYDGRYEQPVVALRYYLRL